MINKVIKINSTKIFGIILVLLLTLNLLINNKFIVWTISKEHFVEEPKNEPKLIDLKRPFVNLYDDKGNQLNVALLSRPFYLDSNPKEYEKMKPLFNILGISSYQEFPNEPFNPKDGFNKTTNKYDYDKWTNMCEGWLHCFKKPEEYLPKNMKNILLSESDFCDTNINKPNKDVKKKYDFLYVCHRDNLDECGIKEWVAFNKNLELRRNVYLYYVKKRNIRHY